MANAGQFKKGKKAGPGRPKGVPNKLTLTVRDAFKAAFDALQDKPGAKLADWAEANPTDFYKISAKLIPQAVEAELTGNVEHEITKIVRTVVDPKSANG